MRSFKALPSATAAAFGADASWLGLYLLFPPRNTTSPSGCILQSISWAAGRHKRGAQKGKKNQGQVRSTAASLRAGEEQAG